MGTPPLKLTFFIGVNQRNTFQQSLPAPARHHSVPGYAGNSLGVLSNPLIQV